MRPGSAWVYATKKIPALTAGTKPENRKNLRCANAHRRHGPSDWNRTSGLLNPILSPRLFVAENKEIIQLFRAFAIFRIVFISYFPYIPLAFRLYSTSVVGEERATMRPSLERSLLHPLSNRRAKSLLLVALLIRALMRFRLFIVVDSN